MKFPFPNWKASINQIVNEQQQQQQEQQNQKRDMRKGNQDNQNNQTVMNVNVFSNDPKMTSTNVVYKKIKNGKTLRSKCNRCTRFTFMLHMILLFSFQSKVINSANTIPRSTRHNNGNILYDGTSGITPHTYPPWNPSKKINAEGFLNSLYPLLPGEWEEDASLTGRHSGAQSRRTLRHQMARIRQVPGDGNCLFHALSTCLSLAVNGTHANMRNTTLLSMNSALLRCLAVDCLSKKPKKILFLQGEEYLRAKDLVEAAASQYNMTGEDYCNLMRKDSYWGGGPEIVALCNVLRRPIHVYELTEDLEEYSDDKNHVHSPGFRLRRMACFGSPKFDRRDPLHILSADSRFPDIAPGRHLASGNHFLAMFPVESKKKKSVRKKSREEKVRVRGGRYRKRNNNPSFKANEKMVNDKKWFDFLRKKIFGSTRTD